MTAQLVLAAGQPVPCDDNWRDVFAVVRRGTVEIRTPHGGRLLLVAGDVLCLARIGPAVLCAVGPLDAVLMTSTANSPRILMTEGVTMHMKLELVPVPVADVDRSATFYERLGFNRDVDVSPSEGVRVVQLTPPGSACSILLSTGLPEITDMVPGTVKGLHLVVNDIAGARQELLGRGVAVDDIVAVGGGVSYARIADPDGNTVTLQQMDWRTGDAF